MVSAELDAPSFGDRQGGLDPVGNQLRFILGYRSEQINRQPVRLGQVDSNKINVTLAQA